MEGHDMETRTKTNTAEMTLVSPPSLPEYRINWDTPGASISGPAWVHQFYVPGYGYRNEGRIETADRVITFPLPTGLHDQLVKTRGREVTITYIGREGSKKVFSVEPTAVQA